MKADILKFTKLSEKQFYDKYATEADFRNSPEGKAFFRAQKVAQFGFNLPGMMNATSLNQPEETLPDMQQYLPSGINKGNAPFSNPNPGAINTGGDTNRNGIQDIMEGPDAAVNTTFGPKNSPYPTKASTTPKFGPQDAINIGSGLFGAGQALKGEFDTLKNKRMWHKVTGAQVAAAKTTEEPYEQKYDRPEDYVRTGETQKKTFGVGYNPIVQNGSMISNQFMQGNPGEIQNTFDPYDIYMDEGFEPINKIPMKQYQMGGQMASALSNPANSFISSQMNHNAGYQFGDALGKGAQFIPGIGPIASAVASPLLGLTLGQIDKSFGPAGKIAKEQSAIDRDVTSMGLSARIGGSRNTAVTQDGGMLYARNWNPQMISHYGNHTMKELMKPDPMMNTLQGGGLASGGELQTLWGGHAEPISRNPYLPDGGETVMFRGNSHRESDGMGNTGIGAMFGRNKVEVENREPGVKLQNGGETAMTIFGDIKPNKMYAAMMGIPEVAGKTLKSFVAGLSKKTNKHTQDLNKAMKAINDQEIHDSYDKLALASQQANAYGNDKSLEIVANQVKTLGNFQSAVQDTKQQLSSLMGRNVSAPDLAQGKFKYDTNTITKNEPIESAVTKNGGYFPIAQNGKMTTAEAKAKGFTYDTKRKGWYKTKKAATKSSTKSANARAMEVIPKGQKRKSSGTWGKVTPEMLEETKLENPWYDWTGFDPSKTGHTRKFQQAFNAKAREIGSPARLHPDDAFGEQTQSARLDTNVGEVSAPAEEETVDVEDPTEAPVEDEKANWWNVLGAALPYIRPSNAGVLDTNQLMGEMYGLSNNQVEPVQAVGYQPELDIPQYYSMQDQRNAITGQTRAAQRMAGYNPAAQASIAASAYDPINQINAEEFRTNQTEQAGVYDRNRATMNQAKQYNAAAYADQFNKMSQAYSNTKAITLAALSSIADKYQKNALENKTLQTYENLYNYRYGPGMKAYNVNAPFNPNMPTFAGEGDADYIPVKDDKGEIKEYRTKAKKEAVAKEKERNGSIVKALKRM